MSQPAPTPWGPMNRFVLRKRLGEGGMGVVFRALDRERDEEVALKTMRYPEPEEIYRLKREFRSLAGLAHPNLVTLHELFADGDECFFTMEVVDGVDLLRWVRGRPAAASLEVPLEPLDADGCARLREVLRQLATGLHALHAAGKLHRDVKPSNVMVEHGGRVVLLDFGLATTFLSQGSGVTDQRQMVGTVAYMPPEQGFGGTISAASDWYSVGVMLYEALTGRVPFVGSPLRVMLDKSQVTPPSPRSLFPELPEELDALAMALLAREPAARPGVVEIFARLGLAARAATTLPSSVTVSRTRRLVGRDGELAELERALVTSELGPVVVQVHGPSGVGKTALLERFAARCVETHDATVLAGRCYLQESVPFKALDGVVDALSRHLVELRGAERRALCPEGATAVSRVFPVLGRVDELARPLGEPPGGELEPREVRRRAIGELRELLGRLARRGKVVVWIDDLQWGDLDSAAVLRALLAPPAAPSIVCVLSFRSEDRASSPALRALLEPPDVHGASPHELPSVELELAALSEPSVRLLAAELLGVAEGAEQDRPHVEAIVSESGGNPFFAWELARHLLDTRGHEHAAAVSLAGLVRHRVERLPGGQQRLLEIVAVAGGPLDGDVAFRAAGIRETSLGALSSLGGESLLRQTPVGERACLDVYHDRIRATVLAALPADVRRARHREIAEALTALARSEPRMLSEHWAGAGELALARRDALAAAERAASGVAFHEAATFYRRAIEYGEQLGSQTTAERAELESRIGHVLAQAGRSGEAAEAYLAAARGLAAADAARVRELRRLAAEQYLRGGHLDEGLTLMRAVLAEHDLGFPESPSRAVLSVLWQRAHLRWRGLEHARRQRPASAEAVARVDACWSAALGLAWVDAIRSTDFQLRHARLALELGDPARVVRALGTEATFLATEGGRRNRRRSRDALALAEALAARIDQPYAHALVGICGAGAAFFDGRWREAIERGRGAEELLRGHCTGVAWELLNAHLFSLWALAMRGELGELCLALPRLLAEARERGDVLAATSLASGYLNVAWLVLDRPQDARARAESAMSLWSRSGVHSQHFLDLIAQANLDLYEGAPERARERIEAAWPPIARAQMLRVQVIRGQCLHLRGRTALACAAAARDGTRRRLLAKARADARALRDEDAGWAPPLGDALLAGAAELAGAEEEAERLWCRAAAGLAEADLGLHAAVARLRHGALVGGDGGRRESEAALDWMRARSIVAPAALAAMIAPGRVTPP